MDLILYKGLASTQVQHRLQFITSATGYSARQSGNDFVVSDNDPALVKGPGEILFAPHEPWKLVPANFELKAREFVFSFRNTDFDKAPIHWPKSIEIDDQYGLKSELETEKLRFFGSRGEALVAAMVDHIFPLFVGKLSLDLCYPVRVDARRFQKLLTLQKIPLLISEFGSAAAEEHVRKGRALHSIMPESLDPLSYLDALLVLGQLAIALPLHQHTSSLYFRAKGLCTFSNLGIENNFEQLMTGLTPLVADGAKRQHFLNKGLGNAGYERMFGLAVRAVNNILKFLLDPRTFLENNELNGMRQLQAHATMGLVMADLQSTNFSASPYLRLKLSLSALDKIANLWKGVSRSSKSEVDIFKHLLSTSLSTKIKVILKEEFSSISRTAAVGVGKTLGDSHRNMFARVREEIGSSAQEGDVLEALRTLRNASHGAFLQRSQFEVQFLTRATSIPNEIEVYVFYLIWAICLRPGDVLGAPP